MHTNILSLGPPLITAMYRRGPAIKKNNNDDDELQAYLNSLSGKHTASSAVPSTTSNRYLKKPTSMAPTPSSTVYPTRALGGSDGVSASININVAAHANASEPSASSGNTASPHLAAPTYLATTTASSSSYQRAFAPSDTTAPSSKNASKTITVPSARPLSKNKSGHSSMSRGGEEEGDSIYIYIYICVCVCLEGGVFHL